MNDNKKRILEMLAQNKISADDAYRLLNAIDSGEGKREETYRADSTAKDKARFLRVTVMPNPDSDRSGDYERVNIRVPMSLIRAGIKLTSLIPPEAREKVNGALQGKGIDFDLRNMKSEDIEEIIKTLSDLEVDVVGSKGERVRVFVE